MKTIAALLAFAAACVAQNVDIASPSPLTPVSSGNTIVVEVDRHIFTGTAEEEVLIISLPPCIPQVPLANCDSPSYDPSKFIPDIVYNGPYAPVDHGDGKPPYQNFTVQVPVYSTQTTQASLIVTHFSLFAAESAPGPQPFLEVKNIILDVVQ